MSGPFESGRYCKPKAETYHDTLDCSMIELPENYSQRSVRALELFDFSPCRFCHDWLETPGANKNKDWSYQNALRKAAKED